MENERWQEYTRWITLLLLPVALALAFNQPALPDSAYGALLKDQWLGGWDIDTLKIVAVGTLMASGALAYWAFREKPAAAWMLAILLILAPGVITNLLLLKPIETIQLPLALAAVLLIHRQKGYAKALGLVPLAGVLYLASMDGITPNPANILGNVQTIGFLMPMALLSLLPAMRENKWEGLYALILAIGLGAVSYPLALAATVLSAAFVVGLWMEQGASTEWWSTGAAAFTLYIMMMVGADYVVMVALAVTAGAVTHLILSLYSDRKGFWALTAAFLLVLSLGIAQWKMNERLTEIPSERLLEAFTWIAQKNGQVALLGFENAFRYTTGQAPAGTAASQLFDDEPVGADYLLFSNEQLLAAPSARAYALVQKGSTDQGPQAVYLNGRYAIVANLDGNERQVVSAIIIDRASGGQSSLPFNKLKALVSTKPLTDPDNLLIHTDGIEDSLLYSIINRSQYAYANGGVYVVKLDE